MGLYKAQFISMIIMIALGIGVFIGFNMEWVSIDKNTQSFFKNTGFADYRIVSEKGFAESDLEAIKKIEGVKDASRYISAIAEVKEKSGDAVALTVTENEKVSGMKLIKGSKYDSESTDGIWLSDKYANANKIKIGDKLTFIYKNTEINGQVQGFVKSGEHMICLRDETQMMPDYDTFGFAYISPVLYEKSMGTSYYSQINVISKLSKKEFTKVVNENLNQTMLVLTKDESISYNQAKGEANEGKTMGSILPVLFLLIAVLTMVTTMHRLTAKEKTQIGTLKALGFKDKRIFRHYTSYALIIGIIGSVFGVVIGYILAWSIMNPNGSMGTYFDMPEWKLYLPWFCYVILAGLIVLLTFIGFLSVKKMLRGTAADALREYSPKKMKNMLIEKTKLFHKLSFGTRWNMRDIMRHKSRTAMSLVGIVGCMMIVVCALGMRNTLDSFLDLYYNGATNYSSHIFISEEATKKQREDLVAKYNGDWSSSINVQLDENVVSLDIYNVRHGMIRFPNKKNNYIKLSNDGAYVCTRIANEFKFKPGDTFTVSPFGSDNKYTLKVAGIIRSVSKNIVITPEYAKTLNLPYSIDSIYTDTEKSDIPTENTIKSVQSKQMIMDSFDEFMGIMNLMIYILILAAAVLGIVVLYNLGVMSYTERYREMATLKVVGFKDKKIGNLLIGQNLWITVIGVILGIPGGIGALDYLLTVLGSEYEMKIYIGPLTYIISIALTFCVSLLVSLMVSRKNKKIDMVEALKGAE